MRLHTLRSLWLIAAMLVGTLPVLGQSIPFTVAGNVGSANKLDLGAFTGGAKLTVTASGVIDLTSQGLFLTDPNGALLTTLPPPYTYTAPGATNYPTLFGGDGINHFPGGGTNIDAPGGNVFPFAGAVTTDTTNHNAIRYGALVGTFSSTPAREDWFLIGSSATLMVPNGGAHLFLAVNDTASFNNSGSFTGTVTVPEVSGLAQAVTGLLTLGGLQILRLRRHTCRRS